MSEELRPYGTDSTDPPAEPLTREEQYLSAIAGVTSSSDIPPKPLTRVEKYLNKIVENGGGGGSVYGSLEAGVNITIEETSDGKAKISASGEVSSEDAVARADIAEMKDGTTIDSFGDVETALATKADTSTTYTKTEVDTALRAKANSADVYTKTAVDTALSAKADTATTYTKTEVDTALGNKVDKVAGKGLSTEDFTTAEKTKLDDLAEIKSIGTGLNLNSSTGELTATGGGGGTSDYTDLSNKPQINSVTLTGNKTTSDLGIDEVPDVGENDDGKVLKASYSGGVGTYSWQTGGGSGGTSDYTDLTNKPQINSVTLSGNKSLSDLGIAAAADIPTVPITEIQRNSTTISPVSGVVNISVPTSAADVSAIPTTEKGANSGVATLDSSGKLTSSQLPSISEVPTVGSGDNGKVLTAAYSSGSGSYEWATADDRVYYCTCSTSASTAKKAVATSQDFTLKTGCIIAVKFSNANTASNVQLNVNFTGDKTIAYSASNPYTGNDKVVTGYGASQLNYYIYNGTNWRWAGCTAPKVPEASSATPQPLGTAAAGSSSDYSRADHVHAMPATATTSAAGLMSATDKTNLNSCVTNIAKLISEIKTINISDITWTASGQGMYYSSEISLNSIKTILGWCFVEINGLKPENWLLVSQNTTSLGKFRLLAASDNFYSEAQAKIRLYGTTDELT